MKRLSLFLLWVLVTSSGPVLAVLLVFAVYLGLLPALQCETVSDMIHPVAPWHPWCSAVLWPAIALCVALPGLLQWAVLRIWGVLRNVWWVPLTALGWIGIYVLTLRLQVGSDIPMVVLSGFAGVILGLPQWFALRGISRKAWLWIPVSAAGTLIIAVLTMAYWLGLSPLLSLVPYGILTGAVLVWLLDHGASHSQGQSAPS